MTTLAELSKQDIQSICEQYLIQTDLTCRLKQRSKDLLENQLWSQLEHKSVDQTESHLPAFQLENNIDNQHLYQPTKDSDYSSDQLNIQLKVPWKIQPSSQLKEQYQSHIKLDFKLLHYKVMPISHTPIGFLGRHHHLCVDILRDDGPERLYFFVKSTPTEVASRMEYLQEFGVFKKEILVYSEVMPNLQNIFGNVAPDCYYQTGNETLLVFENLTQKGFKLAASRDGLLNYEHLKCALHTVAAMHAASIVLEKRHGKKIPELFTKAVVENAYPNNVDPAHKRIKYFNNANSALCEMIKLLPKYKDNMTDILAKFPQRMRAIFQFSRSSSKYQNVFSHGDLWANNVMFSYGKLANGTPTECRLVDFQLSRYAPGILDVITILTISTSQAFRERFLYNLLEHYYRFVGEFLQCEQLNIEDYMPRQTFFDSVEEFRVAGLIESCLFSHLTLLPPSLTDELTESTDGFTDFFERKRIEICLKAFKTDAIYRERLTEMIEDFVDNFILK